MQDESIETRIAYLDAARAFAAILGILQHAACGYFKYPVPEWPRYSAQYSIVFDYFSCAIHMFRMPVFFFLAGYFSVTLFKRLSFSGFAKNRFKRILLPFLLFSLLINVRWLLVNLFFHRINSVHDFFLIFQNLSYLWFLEYLLICYVFFIAIAFILRGMKINLEKYKWMQSKWIALYMISLTFIFLYYGGVWYTPVLLNFVPDIWLLSSYAIYFVIGLYMASNHSSSNFFNFKWQYIFCGAVGYVVYIYIILNKPHVESIRIFAIGFYSIASYMLFLSFLSLCKKFFAKKNRVLQFLAGASYWIYLSQIFFIIYVHKYMAIYFDSIFIQYALMTIITLFLTLLTYQIFQLRRKIVT